MRLSCIARYRKGTRRPLQICIVCHEPRGAKKFQAGKQKYLYCAECRRNKKDTIKSLFRDHRPEDARRKKLNTEICSEIAHRRFLKKREGVGMDEKVYATRLAKLPDRVAAVVGKTHAFMGDRFQLADDEAVMKIADLLHELDPTLVKRNGHKRLSRANG